VADGDPVKDVLQAPANLPDGHERWQKSQGTVASPNAILIDGRVTEPDGGKYGHRNFEDNFRNCRAALIGDGAAGMAD